MFPRSNSSPSSSLRRRRGGGDSNRQISTKTIALILVCVAIVVYLGGFLLIFGSTGAGRSSGGATSGGSGGSKNDGGLSSSSSSSSSHADHLDKLAVQHMAGGHHDEQRPPIQPGNDGSGKSDTSGTKTIGWAVTITGCGTDSIAEGAAVLKHAIHLTSIHGPLGGQYDYKMYAIYHPDGEKCAKSLEPLDFTLIRRETPVAVKDIQGEFLRSKIHDNGCCGERELVKLEAYTLTQHPIVVHLDLDVVVLKPMDELFDWMLSSTGDHSTYDTSGIDIMWREKENPKQVNAFFTRDYNMVGPKRKYKPVQGGFLILRPDMDVYNEFVDIIRKGHFTENGGWGNVMGLFYGSMTFQGIVPYFYDVLHPNTAVELNRCVFNQMADNPKDKRTVNDIPQGRCRTDEEECEDCRNRPLGEVKTAHFTLCQKPWLCLPQDSDIIQQRLCRKLHHEWHRIRADLEKSWGRPEVGSGSYQLDHFFGHCNKFGQPGYIPMKEPYGSP